MLLSACSKQPTFEEMKTNYAQNKTAFEQLAVYACDLGNQGKLTFHNIDKSKGELDDKSTKILNNLVSSINGYQIYYSKNEDGSCYLTVGVYKRWFGGSGQSYSYNLNKKTIRPYDNSNHIYGKIIKSGIATAFDMPLFSKPDGPKWYFSYAYA